MRPPGEVSLALLRAVDELATPVRAPTLQEIAQRACVGVTAARRAADNLRRSGKLDIVRQRRVAYRNRPVAEYARPAACSQECDETVDVASIFALWAQG